MTPAPAWPAPDAERYRPGGPRGPAAGAAFAAEAMLALLLVYGLSAGAVGLPQIANPLVSVSLNRQPDPPEHHLKAHAPAQNGRAAPPSLKAESAPVTMPRQVIVPPRPVPVAVAPAQSTGTRPGAAMVPGPGSGLAGRGNGTGSGTGGNGPGAGNGNGDGGGSDAEWTGGKIKDKDYPKSLREAHVSGTTVTEVAVSPAGRPTGCRVVRSSGNRELDSTTCQLILQRFKFRPARSASGEAVAGTIEYEQEWDAPPPPPED